MSNAKTDPQPATTPPLPDVATVGRQYGLLLREAIEPLVHDRITKLSVDLKAWLTPLITDLIRIEVDGRMEEIMRRMENRIDDHMLEEHPLGEHPLGELHQLVDGAVMIRFEHYASIFERFHIAERAINHLVSTGAINESYSGRQASSDLDAIDAEIEALETGEEGEATA